MYSAHRLQHLLVSPALLGDLYCFIKRPEFMLFDIDTTLLNAYGSQEGAAFNYHYQDKGYHPLFAFDGLTGDLMKAELRDGTQYCSKEADAFMKSLLEEFKEDFPDILLRLLKIDISNSRSNIIQYF